MIIGHALDGIDHRPRAQVDLALAGCADHAVEGGHHDRLEARVDLLFGPEQGAQVLDPLEIRDDDTARIGQDVWHDEDLPVVEDFIRVGRRGAVGPFHCPRCIEYVSMIQAMI
jgi:hypothetical protein